MQNSYIIDILLTAALWSLVLFLVIDVRARLRQTNRVFGGDVDKLSVVTGSVMKMVFLICLPLMLVWGFLLNRFWAVMVHFDSMGVGGAGLLAMLSVAGIILIWLDVLLRGIKHQCQYEFELDYQRQERLKQGIGQGASQVTPAQSLLQKALNQDRSDLGGRGRYD